VWPVSDSFYGFDAAGKLSFAQVAASPGNTAAVPLLIVQATSLGTGLFCRPSVRPATPGPPTVRNPCLNKAAQTLTASCTCAVLPGLPAAAIVVY